MRRLASKVSPGALLPWLATARDRALLACLTLLSIAIPELVAAAPPARGGALPLPDPGICAGAVRHPLEVRIVPLGTLRRGAPLALEVRVSARVPVANAEVRIVSTGGAGLRGPARVALEGLAPGRPSSARVEVQVPRAGRRFLLQFVVQGEGAAGVLTRGATYNVLPDGPADPGRAVTTPEGARVIEFAARRAVR